MPMPRVTSRRKLTFLSLFLATCTFIVRAEAQEPPKTLKVTIYYETLCPDSVRFFRSQFRPSMTDKGRYNYTEIEFIPYGKVMIYTRRGTSQSVLYCQHGRRECDLNAKHACIIENTNNNETYNMITGLMSGFNSDLDEFALKYGVNLDKAKSCRESRSAADILQTYGTKTDALNPSFIPTITMDEKFDWDEQTEILNNFDRVFCRKYEEKFHIKLKGC